MSQSLATTAPSISLLLPVRNAQSWLDRVVRQALEVLPELSSRFEIRMLDEGSTDDTADVAAGLSATYPQLLYMPPLARSLRPEVRRDLARHAPNRHPRPQHADDDRGQGNARDRPSLRIESQSRGDGGCADDRQYGQRMPYPQKPLPTSGA